MSSRLFHIKRTFSVSLVLIVSLFFMVSATFEMSRKPYVLKIPVGFPAPLIPADNELTVERIKLGKKLFYDKILSSDSTISCASCHAPEFSFSDNRMISPGVKQVNGDRNSMALVNLAWSNSFFWDGGVSTLEMQVLKPLSSHTEMNMLLREAVYRLKNTKEYVKLFDKAYACEPNPNALFKAIACFERTLISGNSKFDRFFYQKDSSAFNASEKRGYFLFFGNDKVHCVSCHSGVNFSNNTFQNNGLYAEYKDEGRARITGSKTDIGKFKVPTLRNIAYTSPYMHDGSVKTLEDIMEHYSSAGTGHFNASLHVHTGSELQLTPQDKKDLVSFLNALSDEEFIRNPEYRQ